MATIFTPLILAAQSFVETYGVAGTFVIAIFESFIFPVPTAFFVTPATVLGANPFLVAVVATAGSLIGAVIGYALGFYLGKPVFLKLFKRKNLDKVERWYGKWGEWIVLIAAAGPIPFKIVTWCSGMFELNFRKYMLFCTAGRTFQFFVAAYVGNLIGPWFLGVFL